MQQRKSKEQELSIISRNQERKHLIIVFVISNEQNGEKLHATIRIW